MADESSSSLNIEKQQQKALKTSLNHHLVFKGNLPTRNLLVGGGALPGSELSLALLLGHSVAQLVHHSLTVAHQFIITGPAN